MTELLQIVAALSRAALDAQVSVLATVVRTEGATYRRIGARLVVLADGSHVGAVSAGCMETDVLLRAEAVRAAATPELMSFDTRSPDDLTWGYGLGCGGMTELLLEPLQPEQALAKAQRLRAIADSRDRSVLATVIHASGVALTPGDQAVLPDATAMLEGFEGVPASVRTTVSAAARLTLRAGSSAAVRHVWGDQELDIAYEVRSPRLRLCLCGAGPDAVPLVDGARRMGWQVTLIDHRPARMTPEQWPGVDCVLLRSPEDLDTAAEAADCDAVVVMNHHYERDLECLAWWVTAPVPYIGVLGPARRTEQMLATLEARGISLDGVRELIRAPVGLDIGAETAEEIALAIIAEIQAAHVGRDGGSLTQRAGPIHGPAQEPHTPVAGGASATTLKSG
jgi:xanthine dehydrogenase accessory factor